MARQKGAKKRGLQIVNEHFETLFNTASAALGINQSFLGLVIDSASVLVGVPDVIGRILAKHGDLTWSIAPASHYLTGEGTRFSVRSTTDDDHTATDDVALVKHCSKRRGQRLKLRVSKRLNAHVISNSSQPQS